VAAFSDRMSIVPTHHDEFVIVGEQLVTEGTFPRRRRT